MTAKKTDAELDAAIEALDKQPTWQEILSAPFPPEVVKWRAGGSVGAGRNQAFAYVDARDVQDRLDKAFGPERWGTDYRVIDPQLPVIEGTINVLFDGTWIRKSDVGYSNNPGSEKEKEKYKAAYSDAFKRAAVHWGIGHDLYDAKNMVVSTDAEGKITTVPVWVENKGWTVPENKSEEPINALVKRRLTSTMTGLKFDITQAKAAVKNVTGKDSLELLTIAEAEKILTNLADPVFVAKIRLFAEDAA